MSYVITGLSPDEFTPLFELSDEDLATRGVVRKVANAKPGYPCRVTLQDAEPGESLLLLNYESHKTQTPYRSAYAIYIRETARTAAQYTNELPPVFRGRPMALRIFNADGYLIGADLALANDAHTKIETAFANPDAAYIHAHNAAHGCFAAEVRRAP